MKLTALQKRGVAITAQPLTEIRQVQISVGWNGDFVVRDRMNVAKVAPLLVKRSAVDNYRTV